MKFAVHLTLEGPGGRAEAPVKGSPLEVQSLPLLLSLLASSPPVAGGGPAGTRVVGVRVEEEVDRG